MTSERVTSRVVAISSSVADRIDINETLPCGCKNFDPHHTCGDRVPYPVGTAVTIDDILTKRQLTGTVEKVNADGSVAVRWDGEPLSTHVTATAVARRLRPATRSSS